MRDLDIGANAVIEPVGANWQFAGLGLFFGSDTSDRVLHNSSTVDFELYDIE
jgi:hypothetical protein